MPRKLARVRIAVVFLGLTVAAFAAVKFVSYAQKKSAPNATESASITDAVAFAPGGDVNLNGKANPGDKLEGTVTVSATGTADLGTKVTIPISSLLTLDNTFGTNGVQVSPIAAPDTYAATGNIQIAQPTGVGSLLANDIDPVTGNNTGLVATAVTISSANCTGGCSGNVTISANGSFTYISPPNFTGTDTFTYTATSSSGGTTTGTATVNVSDRVVFVSSGAAGNCWQATPCSLATADALPLPTAGKDLVYVLSGTYAAAVFSMNASQNLVGQGVSSAQALSDAGITLATNSTTPGIAASTSPVFNNAGTIVTLSTNNLVERFALNPSGGVGTAGILSNGIISGTSTIRDFSSTATNAANAVSLTGNNGATFNFSGITLAAAAIALNATGNTTSVVNVSNSNASSINAAGQAINANGVTLAATFTTVSASGGTNGISLTSVVGASNFGGGTLTGASGTEFFVSAGSPAVTYLGNITQNNAARVVDIQGTTANTITLSGTTQGNQTNTGIHIGDTTAVNGNVSFTTINLGSPSANCPQRMSSAAITIGSASTSTGTYSLGTLNVCTTGASGLVATNADGTINATAGLIDSSSATAINIDGPAGLTTLGIALTAVNSAGGTADGISIQDTNGSFTVNGDGANTTLGGNSSGGTISNKTGADASATQGIGVYLKNVTNITLRRMTVNGTNQNFGVRGFSVAGFTMEYSTVSGTNGTSASENEGSMSFGANTGEPNGPANGITGTALINACAINGGFEDNLRVTNQSGSLNRLSITGNTISNNSTANGNDDVLIEGESNATINVTATGNTIFGARGTLFALILNGNNTSDLVFNTNTMSNPAPYNANSGSNNLTVISGANVSTGAITTFHAQGNTFRDSNGPGVLLVKSTDPGSLSGTFTANQIGVAATNDSGSAAGSDIKVQNAGLGTVTVAVTNNTLRQYNNFGVELLTGGGATAMSGAFNATVTGNTIGNHGTSGLPMNGIQLNGGTVPGDTYSICTDVGGAGALANTINGSGANAGTDVRLRQRQNTTVRLPGYGGANNDNTAAQNYLIGRNVTAPTALTSNTVGSGGGGFTGGAACAQPSTAPPPLGGSASVALETAGPLGIDQAEMALAEPIENVLGDTPAIAEIVTTPRWATTEQPSSLIAEVYNKLTASIEPTAYAQGANSPDSPTATVTVDGGGAGFTIAAGSSVTIKYRATVNNGPFASGIDTIDNQASAVGSNFATVNSTTASIALDAAPDLSMVIDDGGATTTQPGTTINYTVSYGNGFGSAANNLQDAYGALLTVPLPAGTTYNSTVTPGWTCVGGNCTKPITGPITVNTGSRSTTNFAVDVPQLPLATATTVAVAGSTIAETAETVAPFRPNNGPDLNSANNTAPTDSDNMIGIWTGNTSNVFGLNTNWSNNVLPDIVTGQNIAIVTGGGASAPTLAAGNAVVNNIFFATSTPKNLTITSPSTLTVETTASLGAASVVGTGTLIIDNGATITRTTGQVNCALQKNFLNGAIPPPADGAADVNAPDAPDAVFTFPVGTGAGFFPVDVTPTAGSTGSLTIQTFDGTAGVAPPLNAAKTLGRYWTVSGGAGITASMKFFYNATTINGTETNYKPQRVTAGVATSFFDNCPSGTCVDETNNFIFMPAVSNGSFAGNWTASELAPTAAQVAVAGRVLTADGQAIRGVRITLDDGTGHAMTAISNAFGYYRFDEVQSGGTYIMNATARGYTFTPRVMSVNDELTDVTLTALP